MRTALSVARQPHELWHVPVSSAALERPAQVEQHMVDGEEKTLLVHRKGSTRAFPPHHPLIPVDYQLTGQPVLIGGTMGTHSYVLTGPLRSCLRSALCPVSPILAPQHHAGSYHSMPVQQQGGCKEALCREELARDEGAPGGPGLTSVLSAGTEKGMAETFGSTCHGAGRASSRNSARRNLDYQTVCAASSDCSSAHIASPLTHSPAQAFSVFHQERA